MERLEVTAKAGVTSAPTGLPRSLTLASTAAAALTLLIVFDELPGFETSGRVILLCVGVVVSVAVVFLHCGGAFWRDLVSRPRRRNS